MNQNIQDIVVDKDVRCPNCGGEMKIISSNKGKSSFQCENCGYRL